MDYGFRELDEMTGGDKARRACCDRGKAGKRKDGACSQYHGE